MGLLQRAFNLPPNDASQLDQLQGVVQAIEQRQNLPEIRFQPNRSTGPSSPDRPDSPPLPDQPIGEHAPVSSATTNTATTTATASAKPPTDRPVIEIPVERFVQASPQEQQELVLAQIGQALQQQLTQQPNQGSEQTTSASPELNGQAVPPATVFAQLVLEAAVDRPSSEPPLANAPPLASEPALPSQPVRSRVFYKPETRHETQPGAADPLANLSPDAIESPPLGPMAFGPGTLAPERPRFNADLELDLAGPRPLGMGFSASVLQSLQSVQLSTKPSDLEQIKRNINRSLEAIRIDGVSSLPSTTQASLATAMAKAWQWLKDRSQRSDFSSLLHRAFGVGEQTALWQQQQATILEQLNTGLGLPNLSVVFADSATMQGLLGAYASQHPSGTPTILVNETFFSTASEEQRLKLLLQEIGHSIDDRLNGPGIDSRGDEGAFFAQLITAKDPNSINAARFNYNDHFTIDIQGVATNIEASAGLINPGFEETSPLAGWTALGSATTSTTPMSGWPDEGSRYAVISSTGSAAGVATIESSL
ncbi:MAG: hypothetical protein EBZ76_08070, partial [Synechococcaceae bacterium WB9_2_170]|nr:hypothetical protein [Synechococcaceae bacterium WB9_2_170]